MKLTILTLFLSFILVSFAQADEYRPAYLELTQTSSDVFDMLWKVPAKGQGERLALYVHFSDDVEILVPANGTFVGAAFIERSVIRHPTGLADVVIKMQGLEEVATDVLVRIQRLDGSSETARLDAAKTRFVVNGSPEFIEVLKTYFTFGVEHILEGNDHLLFVTCLVFIAGTWRRILITITGFTFAHSVTLTMAALELVYLPIPPIEAVIALSVVFLAREMSLPRRDTLTWRYPVAVSSSFGLLHGFGFASALNDIGLPQTEIPTALLAFNAGVEVGQILFVTAVLSGLWVFKKMDFSMPKWASQLPAYAIGTTAAYWCIVRTTSFY